MFNLYDVFRISQVNVSDITFSYIVSDIRKAYRISFDDSSKVTTKESPTGQVTIALAWTVTGFITYNANEVP